MRDSDCVMKRIRVLFRCPGSPGALGPNVVLPAVVESNPAFGPARTETRVLVALW